MTTFNFIISVLVLYYFGNTYCLKQCNEMKYCITISSCPEAARLQEYRKTNLTIKRKFKSSICNTTWQDGRPVTKVCCPDFEVEKTESMSIPILKGKIGNEVGNLSLMMDDGDFTNHNNIELLPKTCGKIYKEDEIIGGEYAHIYEFPWMALIAIRREYNTDFECGGSIISSKYILTAGHCVHNLVIERIRVGEYDLSSFYDCEGEYPSNICENHLEDFAVEKSIVHENYRIKPVIMNDIALLRVKGEITFAYQNVAPICLPVYKGLIKSQLGGKIVTVAGWGLTATLHKSARLLKVSVPVLMDDKCDESGEKKIICAGGNGKDACQGDSGSPLIYMDEYVENNNTKYSMIQYGIVSRGPMMCSAGPRPGIYTDVRKYMRWILDSIEK